MIMTWSVYDPIDVIRIYTIRPVIEILFSEPKEHLHIKNIYPKSVNDVLFELFATVIVMVLIYWLRQRLY